MVAENGVILASDEKENSLAVSEIDIEHMINLRRAKGGFDVCDYPHYVCPWGGELEDTALTRTYQKHPHLPEKAEDLPTYCERMLDIQVSGLVKRMEYAGLDHCVVGISGGVDSTVVAVLLHKAIGKNLHCIFVDNGVLRSGEGDEVVAYLREHCPELTGIVLDVNKQKGNVVLAGDFYPLWGEPELTDRLPLEAVVHYEKYTDYTAAEIDELWAEREESELTRRLLEENGLPNLAQVFTERRYVRRDNLAISRSYFALLKEKGFFNN